MAATYDYQTGRIEHDYHFIRYGEKCRLSGLPCYAGNDRCLNCQQNAGTIHPFSYQLRHGIRLDDSYVLCKHKEAKDSENSGLAKYAFNEQVKYEALCALCH